MYENTQIIGHIGGAVDLKLTTQNQKKVVNFSVCCNSSWTNKTTGQKQEHAEWYNCVAWNKLAEIMATYMSSGNQVMVVGRMRKRSYEVIYKDKAGNSYNGVDGQPLMETRYTTELVANDIKFLGKKSDSSAYQPSAVQAATPAAVAATFIQPNAVAPAYHSPAAVPVAQAPIAAPVQAPASVQPMVVTPPPGV